MPTGKHSTLYEGLIADILAVAAVVIVICLLTYQSRFYPEVSYDESAAYLGSQLLKGAFGFDIDPSGVGEYFRYYSMDCYPPTYYLATAAVFAVSGVGIIQARLVSVLFIGATALLCYVVGRRLAGYQAGLIALATYLYVPTAVYAVVNRPDVGVPFFILASLWALTETIESPKLWLFFLSGLLYGLGATSHFFALLAGPLFALLLWYSVGLRFWSRREFWIYLSGWLLPVLGYLALIYPFYRGTLLQLVNYGSRGVRGDHTIADIWPFRPALQHITVLKANFPELLTLLVVIAVVFPVLVLSSRWVRNRIAASSRVFVFSLPVLWFLVGIYPNIEVLGYYAPAYIVLGAVVCGIVFAAFCPSSKLGQRLWTVASITILGLMLSHLNKAVNDRVAQMDGIPVTAALQWTQQVPEISNGYIGAIAHWWFSAAGARVRKLTTIRSTPDGPTEFDALLLKTVPDHPRFRDISGYILDLYTESYILQDQNIYSIFSNYPGVTMKALFLDPVHRSGSYAIFTPYRGESVGVWPRLGQATSSGPVTLRIDNDCTAAIKATGPQVRLEGRPDLYQLRFEIGAGLPHVDKPLLIRTTFEAGQDDSKAEPFLAFYSSREQEAVGLAALQRREAPWADVIGFAAQYLPSGERGRDLLIPAQAIRFGSSLVVYAKSPLEVRGITLGLPLTTDETCSDDKRQATKKIGESFAGSALFATPPALTAQIGEPYKLEFSRKESGELVFWRNGSIVGRQPFKESQSVTIMFKEPAPNGFEVWIDNAPAQQRTVTSLYPVVKPSKK